MESPQSPTERDLDALNKAGAIIRAGGLVAFPTETVYGLGANALDSDAVPKIFAAKGRPGDNPLIVHIAAPQNAGKYVLTTPLYDRLAEKFMPGPISIIMRRRECIPDCVTAKLDTAAVRCPSHPTAHAFIEAAGVPIAAPSANLSGKPSPTTAAHVLEDMDGRVDLIIDGGECECGVESTVVKLDGDSLTVLRPGSVTPEMLMAVTERVSVSGAVTSQLREGEKALSPGMKYKHYAPTTPVILLDGSIDGVAAYLAERAAAEKCAVLCYDGENVPNGVQKLVIGAHSDPSQQAHRLFSLLREADTLGVDVIYAHLPDTGGVSLALYNRMIRAAAYKILKVT